MRRRSRWLRRPAQVVGRGTLPCGSMPAGIRRIVFDHRSSWSRQAPQTGHRPPFRWMSCRRPRSRLSSRRRPHEPWTRYPEVAVCPGEPRACSTASSASACGDKSVSALLRELHARPCVPSLPGAPANATVPDCALSQTRCAVAAPCRPPGGARIRLWMTPCAQDFACRLPSQVPPRELAEPAARRAVACAWHA